MHIEKENIDLCEFLHVHDDVVENVKQAAALCPASVECKVVED